jgi:hypothetical protein
MSGLKVGVLTFHRCINYGSYWQARCLVEALQSRGHDAVILDHHNSRVNIAEWKCALHPVLPIAVPAADRIYYRRKIEKFFNCFAALPLSKRFSLLKPQQMEDYDIVIVGSDEVWNLFHPWYGKNPLFFSEGINADKIISYAASFGNYPAIWGLEEDWSKRLLNFDAISVRDENSYYLVKNAIGVEPCIVLDPCLQFPLAAEEREIKYAGNYIAVYGHNFSGYFITMLKKYSKYKNFPLISIGYRNDWADEQWLDADPHDFACFMQRSSAVATNFFHGCVFSLLNEKPFVCETSPYRNNKVYGLMNLVGGEDHLMNEKASFKMYDQYLSDVPQRNIFQRIELLRRLSNEYLDKAFGLEQLQVA